MLNPSYKKRNIVIVLITCLFLCVLISGCFEDKLQDDNILYVNAHGGSDYSSIQNAIDDAPVDSKIMVMNGIYHEHLIIEKSIILDGESKVNTIIDGNGSDDVIKITDEGRADISNFTIRNSGIDRTFPHNAGIKIESSENKIHHNIIANNSYGLISFNVGYNQIFDNDIDSNMDYGVFLYQNEDDVIQENKFEKNDCAIRVKGSVNITVYKNRIQHNTKGLQFCCGSRNNEAYHNIFLNNSLWHADDDAGSNNKWNKSFPIGGNYWDDYNGNDNDNDGLGDSSYDVVASEDIKDFLPLIKLFVFL